MYLMYVDESGDAGLNNTPTRYFVLSGVVVHELRWQVYLEQLIAFRRRMREEHGLRMRDEIHAAAFISRPGHLIYLKRHVRLSILREFADEIADMTDFSIINVVTDKQGKGSNYDVFEKAWQALIQRFENTLSYRNFAGPQNPDERGMLFPDHTDDRRLELLLRRMRRYNPVPNRLDFGTGHRNLMIGNIVEDPNFRRSDRSYFVQIADLAAFLLYQKLEPNAYMRKKSGHNYFHRLEPVLCKKASSTDALGIVRL